MYTNSVSDTELLCRLTTLERMMKNSHEGIAQANLQVYHQSNKANDAQSQVVRCKDGLKFTGESSVAVSGVAATVFGGVLCAIPGAAIFGVPMLAAGIASAATGGTLLGVTGSHVSKRNKIYQHIQAQGIDISYNEANDLADGKTVNVINKNLTIQKIRIIQSEIEIGNPVIMDSSQTT